MTLPYYKRFPHVLIDSTIGLPFEQKGAYGLLIDLIFMNDGLLRDDSGYIAGHLGCSKQKWNSIRAALISSGYIWIDGGCIHARGIEEFRTASGRTPLPKWLRAFILERDGYTCTYCGDTDGPFHVDHVLPVSKGGSDDPENLVCACATCNLSKSDKTLSEWSGGGHV